MAAWKIRKQDSDSPKEEDGNRYEGIINRRRCRIKKLKRVERIEEERQIRVPLGADGVRRQAHGGVKGGDLRLGELLTAMIALHNLYTIASHDIHYRLSYKRRHGKLQIE